MRSFVRVGVSRLKEELGVRTLYPLIGLSLSLLSGVVAGCGQDKATDPPSAGRASLAATLEFSGAVRPAVSAGDTLTALVTLSNSGDGDAADVRIALPLIAGFRFLPQAGGPGTMTIMGDSAVLSSMTVAAGQAKAFRFRFQIPGICPDGYRTAATASVAWDADAGVGLKPQAVLTHPPGSTGAAPTSFRVANANGTTLWLTAPGVPEVFVAGTFNNWLPSDPAYQLLRNPADGRYGATIPVIGRFEYKFILRNAAHTRLEWVGDPQGRIVGSDTFGGLNSIGGVALPAPVAPLAGGVDPSRLVIYELFVDDFSPARSFNALRDGLTGGTANLSQLGINALELMPVTATRGTFNWGYEPQHYFALDPDYGDPGEFAALVSGAHAEGMAVLLDMVMNHVGQGNPLQIIDEMGTPGTYISPTQPVVFGMRQINWESPVARTLLRDAALFWIEQYGVDGFRMDAVDPADYPGYRWWRDEIKSRHPQTFIIGEEFNYPASSSMVNCGFDASWGGQHTDSWGGPSNNFQNTVMAILKEAPYSGRAWFPPRGSFDAATNPMWGLANVLSPVEGHATPFNAIKYIVSHDERRVVDEVNRDGSAAARTLGGARKARLGAVLLMTAAGIPMFYMGEEIGASNYIPDSPAPNPLDWTAGDAGLRTLYRRLIRLRLSLPGLAAGGIEFACPSWGAGGGPCQVDKLINYWRYAGGDPTAADLVVAANLDHADHAATVAFPRAGTWYDYDVEAGSLTAVAIPAPGKSLNVMLPASTARVYLAALPAP